MTRQMARKAGLREILGAPIPDGAEEAEELRRIGPRKTEQSRYFADLKKAAAAHLKDVDRILAEINETAGVGNISGACLGIVRQALLEVLYMDIPLEAAAADAKELADAYCPEGSYRLVNSMLRGYFMPLVWQAVLKEHYGLGLPGPLSEGDHRALEASAPYIRDLSRDASNTERMKEVDEILADNLSSRSQPQKLPLAVRAILELAVLDMEFLGAPSTVALGTAKELTKTCAGEQEAELVCGALRRYVRHSVRKAAMQELFGYEMTGDTDAPGDVGWEQRGDEKDAQYIRAVRQAAKEHLSEVDEIIRENSQKWKLERIAKVDLAILRLAILEMEYLETPERVAVNEAVELAKEYSGDKAYKFVNGVLGGHVRKRSGKGTD